MTLLVGDTKERIAELDDSSVELIITSPPYGNIVDYNHPDQIGHGQTVEQYYGDLDMIWDHCIRILHPGCRLVINIGDEFVKSQKNYPYHIRPHRSRIIEKVLSNPDMIYTGTIIWKKVNGSASGKNGGIIGSINTPRNGHFFINREYIMTFKKRGKGPKISRERKDQSRFTAEQRRQWFRDTWKIVPESQNNHPAQFPVELPQRLIQMYTFVGETVFDPFCGSGSTLIAAEVCGRNSIGIEIGWQKDWKEMIKEKITKYSIQIESINFT